jgi:8-oxo-dGTP diphosphatase
MITLNSDTLTIDIPTGVFDTALGMGSRHSNKPIGHVMALKDKDNIARLHLCINPEDSQNSLIQEALLSLSQYLLHREPIHHVIVEGLAHVLDFGDDNNVISINSIHRYANTLPVIKAAIVIIENENGSFLLGQRPEGKFMPGLWEFPGGKIEDNETPEEAGKREVAEEIGIAIQNSTEITQVSYCFLGFRLEGHLWRSSEWTGFAKALHHQHIKWVKPKELDTYAMPVSNLLFLPQVLNHIPKIGEDTCEVRTSQQS